MHAIHQEVSIAADPARVYQELTDADRFSARTGGAPTEIDPRPGGAFSCFGGMIEGRMLECAPGERVVQAWRVKTWEPGVYSIARFELVPEGGMTRIVFDHTGFPEDQGEHLAEGWQKNYWAPLKNAVA